MPHGWEGNRRSGVALAHWFTEGKWASRLHFSKEHGTHFTFAPYPSPTGEKFRTNHCTCGELFPDLRGEIPRLWPNCELWEFSTLPVRKSGPLCTFFTPYFFLIGIYSCLCCAKTADISRFLTFELLHWSGFAYRPNGQVWRAGVDHWITSPRQISHGSVHCV